MKVSPLLRNIRIIAKRWLLAGLFGVAMTPSSTIAGPAPVLNACQTGQHTASDSHTVCGQPGSPAGLIQNNTVAALETLTLISGSTEGHDSEILDIPIGRQLFHVPRKYISNFDGYQPGRDYFRIRLLLPGLEPESPENAEEFSLSKGGPPHTVLITIEQRTPNQLSGEKALAILLDMRNSLLKILPPERRPNPLEATLCEAGT